VRLGRRPLFFLGVGVVCLVLIPASPSAYRWLNVAMAALSFFWCVLLSIEEAQGRRLPTEEGPEQPPHDIFEGEERP